MKLELTMYNNICLLLFSASPYPHLSAVFQDRLCVLEFASLSKARQVSNLFCRCRDLSLDQRISYRYIDGSTAKGEDHKVRSTYSVHVKVFITACINYYTVVVAN